MEFSRNFVPRNGHTCVPEFLPECTLQWEKDVCALLTAVSQLPKGMPDTEKALNKCWLVKCSEQVCHWPAPASLVKELPFRNSLCAE